MIRSASALALGLLAALQAPLLTACRGGLNAVCHCASDCRDGLVCEAEGEKTLSADMCFAPGINGRCVEAEGIDTDGEDPLVATEPPLLLDLASNRDFQPGVSDSVSASTTAPTGTATESATDSATDSATGSSTDTSTSSTSTGTSTGTTADTDTSTSSTGTTTDTSGSSSTGTTDSSSSSGSSSGESSSSGSSSTGP